MTEENENVGEVEVSEDTEGAIAKPVVETMVYQAVNSAPDKAGMTEVIAKKDGRKTVVYFDYGDDLAEMTSLFGEDVVYSNAKGKMIIGLQAGLRGRLKASQSIEKLMEVYKPGVAIERLPVDMQKATEDFFAGLSGEEQDAMIERLMEKK